MNQHRKNNHRKSMKSSTNDLWQHIEPSQPSSSGCSTKRPKYPNVPKRTSSINEHETIQTESRIFIVPSERQSQIPNGCSSSTNKNAYIRQTLDLITKYTSPQKIAQEYHHRSLSPEQSQISILSNNESKSKRTLSPMDETNQHMHESKRTKSYDDDDDDEEDLSLFLDHRHNKQISSQNSIITSSSQSTIDGEQRKPTARKPTARKLSATQPKSIISQTQPIEKNPLEPLETLIIEPDIDPEEEDNIISREELSWLSKHSQISNKEHNGHIEPNDQVNQSQPTSIKLPVDNCVDSLNSQIKQNSFFTPVKGHRPTLSPFKRILDNFSPFSNGGERRFSSTSSNSLCFDTPRSSFSRTTTNNMISTPQIVMKTDHDTQISLPSNTDMLNQLISQMNLNVDNNETKIIYNPIELSKKLFHQYNSFSLNNRFHAMNSLIKKQFLNFGRYEIEILFPVNNDQIQTIYACDICLKHFRGSSIAFQRHTSKCLCTQPPGKLVFTENDLAIFQIGETTMNIEQRIYIKSLCRITRLFIDSNKSIDDTKIDRFAYYILCRRDPILSQPQSSLYRFIGYFSKQLNQYAQQSINNLSCLSILPPFVQHKEYNQLMIAFSYFLIRSNASTNLMYSSPSRPLDNIALSAFRTYWRDVIFAYIINQNHSSITTIALDTFSRQTSIHPRDILSSLYSNNFIVPHPTDKSCVYLLNNAYHSMASLNLPIGNKLLFMDMKLIVPDNENKIMIDKQNIDKNHVNGIEEIVLD